MSGCRDAESGLALQGERVDAETRRRRDGARVRALSFWRDRRHEPLKNEAVKSNTYKLPSRCSGGSRSVVSRRHRQAHTWQTKRWRRARTRQSSESLLGQASWDASPEYGESRRTRKMARANGQVYKHAYVALQANTRLVW